MQAANYLEIFMCVAICTFGGIYGIFKLKNSTYLLLPDVMIVFSIFYFGLAPLVSYYYGYGRLLESPWTTQDILLGYSCIFLFLISMALGSRVFRFNALFKPSFTSEGRNSPILFFARSAGEIKTVWILGALVVTWSMRLIQLKYGGGVSGMDTVDVMLSIPYPVVILRQLFSPLYILVIIYSTLKVLHPTRKNYLFILVLILEFLFLAFQGRRDLLFLTMFCGFTYFSIYKKINWKLLGFCSLGAVFIFTVYSKIFLPFRAVARAETNSIYSSNIVDFISQGIKGALAQDKEKTDEGFKKNMMLRPRANNEWIFTIVSSVGPMGAAHGESTFHAIMSALPRILRPPKYWLDHASIIQAHLGLEDFDAADNYVANGYFDFGIPGVIAFGFILAAWLNLGLLMSQNLYQDQPFFGSFFFATFLQFSMNIEASLSAPFVMGRNLAFVFALGEILAAMGFSSRRMEKKEYRLSSPQQNALKPRVRQVSDYN